jgi:hypothetical protein
MLPGSIGDSKMASLRLLPALGLFAVLAFASGALGHHCIPDESTPPSDQLSAQSIASPPSPVALAAYVLVPIIGLLAAVGIAIPSMRKAAPPESAWQFNGTAYVWVPEKK